MKKIRILLSVIFITVCFSACAGAYDGGTSGADSAGAPESAGAGVASATGSSENALTKDSETEPVVFGTESALLHKEEQMGRYCYDSLSVDEQLWYEDMYAIMAGMYTDVELSAQGNQTVGEQGIDKVFQCVMNDHPELFYVKGYTCTRYTYGGETAKINFSGNYTMDADERDRRQALIDAAVEECLAGISMEASDYEKVKYVYEYLILHTEYNQNAEDNQNICSVFIDRQSVCQGYAKATQYLLNKLGVGATLVIGSVYGGEKHAWNLVLIDGKFYYVDTTWGDASYQIVETGNSGSVSSLPSINYDYLCVTTEQLLTTHEIDNVVPLPSCVSMDANYYVMEGAYFTAYDAAGLSALFEKGYDEGRTDVTLKCSDREVYDTFCNELVTNQRIFDYLNSPGGTIAYAVDADKLSLTFWLVNE